MKIAVFIAASVTTVFSSLLLVRKAKHTRLSLHTDPSDMFLFFIYTCIIFTGIYGIFSVFV